LFIFLAVALAIYGLVNFYILRREWQATAGLGTARYYIFFFSLFLVAAFPLGRIFERLSSGWISDALDRFGSFYLVVMLYSFLAILIIDILRLLNKFFHFLPRALNNEPQRAAQTVFFIIIGLIALTVSLGALNAARPRLRTLELSIEKAAGPRRELKIVMASDFHLGSINRNPWLKRVVGMINKLDPDLIVLPGDVVDMYVPRSEGEKMITTLQELKAPLGVYSVTGNHEYYGGLEKNLHYLAKAHIRVLQDESIEINDEFYLLGRKDRTAEGFGQTRKSVKELVSAVDNRLPLILLDHQPFRLDEAREAGIDLQLSGHTHAGQLFPLNWINKMVWEVNWGYVRKERSQYYVSCGVGTWGPPVRTGSRPEVILIKLKFVSPGR
jgi:hypothetical protein